MNIFNIRDIIKDVITQEICCKSILIDGAWGCGKTTAVKEAIVALRESGEFDKNKIVYQSLFGISDVCELSGCYSKVGKIIYNAGKAIATPFARLIPIVGEQIYECINNATTLYEPKEKERKNIVFVFDDLERADPNLSYVSLLGLFNQLILRGCIVICISSLDDLSKIDDNNRKKHLEFFIEKAFDRIVYIDESPVDVIKDIFKDVDQVSNDVAYCADMFDKNLRIAIKTKRLLVDVYKNKEKYDYDFDKKLTSLQVLKSAICSIKSIYGKAGLGENDKDDKANKNVYIYFDENNKNAMFERIVSNINSEITNNSAFYLPEEKDDIKELSRCLVFVDVYNDYSKLKKHYPSKDIDDEYGYSSFFFLNDEDKEKQFVVFKSNVLSGKIVFDRRFVDKFIDIIKYTNFDLKDDNLLDFIINKIAIEAINDNKDSLDRLYDYVSFPRESENSIVYDTINEIYNKIFDIYIGDKKKKLEENINKIINNDDYKSLKDLAYDITNYKQGSYMKKEFDHLLLDNDFYLPDFKNSINYEKWSYCHFVAGYASKNELLCGCFIDKMKEIAAINMDKKSVIDKIISLIQYNFNSDIFESFKKEFGL